MTVEEARLKALEMAAIWANQSSARGYEPSPEDIERWAKRAANFILFGEFDPKGDA